MKSNKVFAVIFSAIATLAGSAAFAADPKGMIAGSYKGTGTWQDEQGNHGSYDIATTVSDSAIDSTYASANGNFAVNLGVTFRANGFFDVAAGAATVGTGYCGDVQCHYEGKFGDVALEETLTFVDGHLYKLGSKVANGVRYSWQEALDLSVAAAK